ncbi:MAG: hypothetical protein J2P41_07235 [Blastocatellia bacterium]|nr:hypothetical protein [Blastocatellia bacterium]
MSNLTIPILIALLAFSILVQAQQPRQIPPASQTSSDKVTQWWDTGLIR